MVCIVAMAVIPSFIKQLKKENVLPCCLKLSGDWWQSKLTLNQSKDALVVRLTSALFMSQFTLDILDVCAKFTS